MSVLRIKSIYNNLSKTERKIADFVLDNYEKVIYMSVTELSLACKASEASIIRFSRKLTYKGFQDFKLSLAKENFDDTAHIYDKEIKNEEDPSEIIHYLQANDIAAINNTVSILNKENLLSAVKLIVDADIIDFYGVEASGFIAEYFAYRFFRIGLNARSYRDSHLQLMSAATLTERSVAIGISFSGCSKEIVQAVKTAKESNAATLAVTNHLKSPITKFVDISFFTAATETPLRSGTSTARITQLFVLDVLYTMCAAKLKDKAYTHLDKTARSVTDRLF